MEFEDDLAVDFDTAAVRSFQAGDAAQGRGFAAAGGAEKRNKLTIGDLEVDMIDDGLAAVALHEAFDGNSHDQTFNGARITVAISATVMTVVTMDKALATPQLAFSKKAQMEIDSTWVEAV